MYLKLKIHFQSCLAISSQQLSSTEMTRVSTETNLCRIIIMWGLGWKENDMEGGVSLHPCVDKPEKLRVVEVESKENFNLKDSGSGFPNHMLLLSHTQLILKLQ